VVAEESGLMQIETGIIIALLTLISALGVAFVNRKSPVTVNTETILSLSKQVRDLAADVDRERERNDMLEDKVDRLQTDVRKFRNGYARALRWIHEKGMTDVPDFLVDTLDVSGGIK